MQWTEGVSRIPKMPLTHFVRKSAGPGFDVLVLMCILLWEMVLKEKGQGQFSSRLDDCVNTLRIFPEKYAMHRTFVNYIFPENSIGFEYFWQVLKIFITRIMKHKGILFLPVLILRVIFGPFWVLMTLRRLLALLSSSSQDPYTLSRLNHLSIGYPYTLSTRVVQFQYKRLLKHFIWD